MKVMQWQNCYNESWNGLIVPEAFSHPAKFSPGLIKRIYQHCIEQGYCKEGQIVVDPFGGIGGGGIFAPMFGLKWIGVELEQKFVDLAKLNFAIHERAWRKLGQPNPVILQGDSRRISSVIEEANIVLTSPPFSEPGSQPPNIRGSRPVRSRWKDEPDRPDNYGNEPGNLGNMKAGYVGAVLTSPPYEDSVNSKQHGIKDERMALDKDDMQKAFYGESSGQLGQESGTTYWESCNLIYRECYKILKPGGVIILVLKSYVKNGRRVPLPMQTLKLLIHIGFTPLERIKALLVKEETTPGLFGDVVKRKERKSFFRRLAEKKGSPSIDWEEILICQKPK